MYHDSDDATELFYDFFCRVVRKSMEKIEHVIFIAIIVIIMTLPVLGV